MIHPLTEETANAAADELRRGIRFHRNAARARLRALERLEADCARVGIRLVRVPTSRAQGGQNDAATTRSDHP